MFKLLVALFFCGLVAHVGGSDVTIDGVYTLDDGYGSIAIYGECNLPTGSLVLFNITDWGGMPIYSTAAVTTVAGQTEWEVEMTPISIANIPRMTVLNILWMDENGEMNTITRIISGPN